MVRYIHVRRIRYTAGGLVEEVYGATSAPDTLSDTVHEGPALLLGWHETARYVEDGAWTVICRRDRKED